MISCSNILLSPSSGKGTFLLKIGLIRIGYKNNTISLTTAVPITIAGIKLSFCHSNTIVKMLITGTYISKHVSKGENLFLIKLIGVALEYPKGFLIAKVIINSIGVKNNSSMNAIVSANMLARMICTRSPESSQTPTLFAIAVS
jgi:hypothetical protein